VATSPERQLMAGDLSQNATWIPGDRVQVHGRVKHDGKFGRVVERSPDLGHAFARGWTPVELDGESGTFLFHDGELTRISDD
jgi:hypothetical protein